MMWDHEQNCTVSEAEARRKHQEKQEKQEKQE